ncbi:MAG: hypothetical protein ABSC29_04430 [Minisyncoccia bacterium]|jgi:hypothetical protein
MKSTKDLVLVVLVVVLIVVGSLAFYYYRAFTKIAATAQPAANQIDVNALVARVEQLIVLPQGETPTVATVVDPNVLKGQAFFANAVKGDLVLIYAGAKKAILYDPSMNKIVEVAPITIGNAAPTAPANATSSAKR